VGAYPIIITTPLLFIQGQLQLASAFQEPKLTSTLNHTLDSTLFEQLGVAHNCPANVYMENVTRPQINLMIKIGHN
jgi:hypothetical protein